jgi:hypothetical protein
MGDWVAEFDKRVAEYVLEKIEWLDKPKPIYDPSRRVRIEGSEATMGYSEYTGGEEAKITILVPIEEYKYLKHSMPTTEQYYEVYPEDIGEFMREITNG